MSAPPGWDAAQAIQRCATVSYKGPAWRIHKRRYPADDPGGSLKVSGRYHRGLDTHPEGQAWAALYLALNPETALAELMRHVTPDLLPVLNDYYLTKLEISLTTVVDFRDPMVMGLEPEDLHHDVEYGVTQSLGQAAYEAGFEGIFVPSATNLGDNLVVFPDHLRGDSIIAVVESRHPRLYVDRRSRSIP